MSLLVERRRQTGDVDVDVNVNGEETLLSGREGGMNRAQVGLGLGFGVRSLLPGREASRIGRLY